MLEVNRCKCNVRIQSIFLEEKSVEIDDNSIQNFQNIFLLIYSEVHFCCIELCSLFENVLKRTRFCAVQSSVLLQALVRFA